MSFITLRQVGVFTPEPLFQNLSLTIGEGCRIGVVAGNGGGKTTLLRCIAGRAEPSEGDITCSRGLRLGCVKQDVPSALLDQTLYGCLRLALPADEQTETWRVDVLLASFDVPEEFHHRTIRALSGGWQKLALIARAFAAEPDALLLDEPTNHVDILGQEKLEAEILAQNATCLLVSHDRSFVETIGTRYLKIENGKLLEIEGTTSPRSS